MPPAQVTGTQAELQQKRAKQLERAKATHLSRQLTMRLQYARLKVDHGWTRQNLNEVENLYFHLHARKRQKGKAITTSPTLPAMASRPPLERQSRTPPPSLAEPQRRDRVVEVSTPSLPSNLASSSQTLAPSSASPVLTSAHTSTSTAFTANLAPTVPATPISQNNAPESTRSGSSVSSPFTFAPRPTHSVSHNAYLTSPTLPAPSTQAIRVATRPSEQPKLATHTITPLTYDAFFASWSRPAGGAVDTTSASR